MAVKYLDELSNLGLSEKDYVIVASGALVAHGLIAKNNDLDIIIKPNKLAELVDKCLLKVKIKKVDDIYKLVFVNDTENVEVCNEVINDIDMTTPLSYYFNSNLVIDGYPYLPMVPLRHFYQCLFNRYHLEKFKKKLELLK